MAGPSGLFWRILPDVRAGERSRFLFFAGLFTLISLAQTMGLAGTEALFLSQLGVQRLASTFVAASTFTVVGSMAYALRVGSARNDSLFLQMLLGSGLLLGIAAVGAAQGVSWVLIALFCFWYLTQAVFQNHFWTFSGDYFDTLASKRLVPLFTIGSSLGGAVGGIAAAGLTALAGPVSLLVAWGVALVGAAAMLRFGHRALRRWGPLELEEADETSVESLRGALRYLRTSSLSRWLVVSALGMVLAFFLAQYLYSEVFTERFPDPTELAVFFSLYLAVTNVIEILFEVLVTPWLIRRIGVPGANLIHPLLMLLSFGGLAFRFDLGSGVASRMARELADNAMAAPIRSLMHNAMPTRFRGRMRAFLEGIVVYAGMAVAGLVLLSMPDPDPLGLCLVGAGASLFYLMANWRSRRAYLRTLVSQLRAGRLDFGEISGAIGGWEASRLAELWEEALREEGRRPSASLLQLIPALAARGIVDPLVRAASHPNAAVRRASVNALASAGSAAVAGPLALALDDPDSGVRLAALRGLARVPDQGGFLESRLRDLLDDLDPRVRAEAALRCGAAGLEVLAKMVGSDRAAEAAAALAVAPPELLGAAMERCRAADPRIRAAALECAARIAPEPPLELEELLRQLEDPDPGVRRAVVLLLANLDDEEALTGLARCLTDPDAGVQRTAETVLGSLGAEGLAAVEPYLSAELERSVEAGLRVVAASGAREAREMLVYELRRHVRGLWWTLIGYQRLPRGRSLSTRFLRHAFRDAMLRHRRLAFRTLELLETASVIRRVDRELRSTSSRARGDALEVLSNLGDRESARLLVLVHETVPLEERSRLVEGAIDVPRETGALLEAARLSENRWVRMAARACQPHSDDPLPEEETMQRLLALKHVDLFANLSFEQIDAVHQATEEAEYLAGEVLCREGEQGQVLYLLIEGSVAIIKGHGTPDELRLATLEAVDYFGEMAILANEPRSASAVALTHCRLLTLDGTSLKELILQMPEISFEIFRVLTARIRNAEARLLEH